MYAKVIILAFFVLSTAYAQTPTCGQVQIQPMTPAQFYNIWTWWGPGAIAASDCYTQYLNSISNSLTQLYNGAYLAGPPQAIQQQLPQTNQQQQQTNQQQPQTNQQQPQTNQQQQQPQTNQEQQQPQTNQQQQQPQTNQQQQQPQTNQQQQQQPQTNPQQPQTTQ